MATEALTSTTIEPTNSTGAAGELLEESSEWFLLIATGSALVVFGLAWALWILLRLRERAHRLHQA